MSSSSASTASTSSMPNILKSSVSCGIKWGHTPRRHPAFVTQRQCYYSAKKLLHLFQARGGWPTAASLHDYCCAQRRQSTWQIRTQRSVAHSLATKLLSCSASRLQQLYSRHRSSSVAAYCTVCKHRRNSRRDRGRLVPQLLGWGINNVLVPQLLGHSFQKARNFTASSHQNAGFSIWVFKIFFRGWYPRTLTVGEGDPLSHPTPRPAFGYLGVGTQTLVPLNFSAVVAPLYVRRH